MNNVFLKRREKVIITAIDLLNEAGINGLTMKEIAARQGITEPAVYKQFDSKNDVIIAILDEFSNFDINIRNTIAANNLGGKEGIKFLTKIYAEHYQNYPQIAAIMFSFDAFRYNVDINKKMVEIINNRYDFILSILNQAKEKGEINPTLDTQVIADNIFGSIWATTYMYMLNKGKVDLKERITKAVNNLLDII